MPDPCIVRLDPPIGQTMSVVSSFTLLVTTVSIYTQIDPACPPVGEGCALAPVLISFSAFGSTGPLKWAKFSSLSLTSAIQARVKLQCCVYVFLPSRGYDFKQPLYLGLIR